MFTEEDARKLNAEIAALADELARLERDEKAIRRAAGLPDEGCATMNAADMAPADAKFVEEAKARAKRAGAERAAKFKGESRPAPANASVGRMRRGVVRL